MPEDHSEILSAETRTNREIARKTAESEHLRDVDGIRTEIHVGFASLLVDPLTHLNTSSTKYKTLHEEEQLSIGLRIQKCGVIDLAQRFTFDNSEFSGPIESEEQLEQRYEAAREKLNTLNEELSSYMDNKGIAYESKDPLTGKDLPKNSIKLYLFNRMVANAAQYGRAVPYKVEQAKCRDFYNRYKHILSFSPDPEARIDTQLYLAGVQPQVLFKETLSFMQDNLFHTIGELLGETHELTGYFSNATKYLSTFRKTREQMSQTITGIPMVAKLFLQYYEDKGYMLPYSQADIPDDDPATATIIMQNCAKSVKEHDEGIEEENKKRINTRQQRYDKLLKRNLERPKKPVIVMSDKYIPQEVIEYDTNTHRKIIEQYGMNADETLRKWQLASRIPRSNDASEDRELYASKIIKKNLEMMQQLEFQRPGISKELYERFGVINYIRCPFEVWIGQYDNRDKTDIDYGITIFATEDHNGAFLNKQAVWDGFSKSLQKENQHMRVIEAEDKLELEKRMRYLRTHYQPQISWGLINAHGYKNGFRLSSVPSGHITSSDFDLIQVKTLMQFFTPEAPLAFISCSTGSFEGIAHKVSAQRNGIVYGPDAATNVGGISWENGKLNIYYGSGRTRKYKNGIEVH